MSMPATIGWRKREDDGMIVVWDLGPPPGAETVPMASPAVRAVVDHVEAKWGVKCDKYEDKYGIPRGFLRPHIARESGGNERVVSFDHGVGLMQITNPGLKGKHSDEELKDPDLNLDIGAKYIAYLGGKYGWDFPRVSAAFNAGSVRDSSRNRWGMVMTTDHVDWEVSAYNYWLSKRLSDEQKTAAMALAVQFTPQELTPDLLSVHVDFDKEEPTEPGT